MSQLERILYINRVIEETGGVKTAQITNSFEISRRQVLRDIAYLRDRLDAPIIYRRQRRWYTYSEPFALFKAANERLLVLGAIFRSLAQAQGMDSILVDGASDALDQSVEGEYRGLGDRIVFLTPIQDWPPWEIFNTVIDAMKRNLRLTLSYTDSQGAATRRHIEALRLINYSGRWYLLAWDMHKQALRTFHLARVASLAPIEGDRTKEQYSASALDQFINQGYGIFLGGELTWVSFRATGWARAVIATQTWHTDQKVVVNDDDSITVDLPVANLNEILSSLLYYGPFIQPLAPPHFVRIYQETIKEMYENL